MTTAQDVKTGYIHSTGINRVSKLIDELWSLDGNKSIRKAATSAIRKGTTIIRKAYRDAAPRGPRKKNKNHLPMYRAVRQTVRRPQRKRQAVAKVGFNVGKGKKRAYHAHFVTTGTKMRRGRGRVMPSNKIQNQVTPRINTAIRKIEYEFTNWVKEI